MTEQKKKEEPKPTLAIFVAGFQIGVFITLAILLYFLKIAGN